jgi:hypothetical protein
MCLREARLGFVLGLVEALIGPCGRVPPMFCLARRGRPAGPPGVRRQPIDFVEYRNFENPRPPSVEPPCRQAIEFVRGRNFDPRARLGHHRNTNPLNWLRREISRVQASVLAGTAPDSSPASFAFAASKNAKCPRPCPPRRSSRSRCDRRALPRFRRSSTGSRQTMRSSGELTFLKTPGEMPEARGMALTCCVGRGNVQKRHTPVQR